LPTGEVRSGQIELFFNRAFVVDINSRFQSPEELIQRLEALATPSSNKFRDPVKVAAEHAAGLRSRNRKTQLADYGARFQSTIMPTISKWFDGTLQKEIKSFTVARAQLNPSIFAPLPSGMEVMIFDQSPSSNPHAIILSASIGYPQHSNRWNVVCRVTVRGDEGVLLAFVAQQPQRQTISPPWVELMSFNPSELPHPEEILKYLKELLSQAFDELTADVDRA
jgi:hypothetical protein